MMPTKLFPILCSFVLTLMPASGVWSAEDLRLRDGISFYQDIDAGFPIIADKMDDYKPDQGKAAFIFFGASGDLNTSRQARRVVDVYRKNRSEAIKFLIVDVDQCTSPEAKELLKKFYTGYIPFELILDGKGKTLWSQIGEVDQRVLQNKIEAVLQR